MRTLAQTPRRRLEAECDKLWQQAIHLIYRNNCCYIGCRSTLNIAGHHIIGRSVKHLRHNILNGILLCGHHHRWAEEHGLEFRSILEIRYPNLYSFYRAHRNDEPQLVWTSHLEETRKQLKNFLENGTCSQSA